MKAKLSIHRRCILSVLYPNGARRLSLQIRTAYGIYQHGKIPWKRALFLRVMLTHISNLSLGSLKDAGSILADPPMLRSASEL